jgi:hypothetical protein
MVWIALILIFGAAAALGSPTRQLLWSSCAAAAVVLLAPARVRQALRYVAVLYHEAGHVLAALVTGGRAHGLVVYRRGGGVAASSGGWRPAVCMAGYLLPMFLGAMLVCWGQLPIGGARMAALAVAHLLLLILARSVLTVLLCVGGAALFGVLAWNVLPDLPARLVLLVFGEGLILEGLVAIRTLIRVSFAAPGKLGSDADVLAREARMLRHPGLWALLIALVAMAVLIGVCFLFALHDRPGGP